MVQPLQEQLRIGLLTGTSSIPQEDSPSEYISYSLVDVVDIKAGGAVLEAGLDLVGEKGLDFMFFDTQAKTWHMHRCRMTDCRPGQGMFHVCEVEFLEHPAQDHNESDLRFLMNTRLFQHLPQNVFLQLINGLIREVFAEDSVLLEQGHEGGCLYILQEGAVALAVQEGNDTQVIRDLGPGDVLGEVALFTGEPRLHTAIASQECVVWRLDKERLFHLLEQFPDLRMFMTELVTKHFESSICLADRIIGKYVVKELLGKGGWGLVYRGEHSILGFQAAVKMLKHDKALDEGFSESFRNEAILISALSHHNIVQVYDIEETYQTLFIIMELLEGQSLLELLERRGQLPYDRTVSILIQVLAALDYAHEHGVVHRDIKPDNIYMLPGDQVKVLDFGLACTIDTEDHSMAGTVYYAPPEQIEGDPVVPASDIYSTGIMAYEMVVGKRPYPEDDLIRLMELHCDENIPDPQSTLSDIPEQLRTFILKSCQREPSDRYASSAEAIAALGGVGSENNLKQVSVLTLACEESKVQQLANLVEEFGEKATRIGVTMKMMTLDDI